MRRFFQSMACRSVSRSPWLMLPSAGEYNFYSPGKEKVMSIKRRGDEEEIEQLVGSSHGWLVRYNKARELSLWNPVLGRQAKLPPTDELPYFRGKFRTRYVGVERAILSHPPDEEDCIALINYSPQTALAFCRPFRSTQWTPLEAKPKAEGFNLDMVYSNSLGLFFCISSEWQLMAWDLTTSPSSPRMAWKVFLREKDDDDYPWGWGDPTQLELDRRGVEDPVDSVLPAVFLLPLEQSNQLLVVSRHVLVDSDAKGDIHETIGFDVHRLDVDGESGGRMTYMDGSLDGLSIFVGRNQGLALVDPDLKPDSIYFSDTTYKGQDNGIFDYKNATFHPCYFPPFTKGIRPLPLWY